MVHQYDRRQKVHPAVKARAWQSRSRAAGRPKDRQTCFVRPRLAVYPRESHRFPKPRSASISCVDSDSGDHPRSFSQQGVRDGPGDFASPVVLVHVKPPHPPHGYRYRRRCWLVGDRSDAHQSAIQAAREYRMKHGSILCEFRNQTGHVRVSICLGVGLQLGKICGKSVGGPFKGNDRHDAVRPAAGR